MLSVAGIIRTFGPAIARAAIRLAGSLRVFAKARSGSVAIEYSVIAGLVGTAIVASLGLIAEPLGQMLVRLGSN
ncbi:MULTISPECIES: Flp family type IVb pilin [unclassified Aureimonas]|uniref:Flp family type IVb pilin n=1 Tax=unclassified Aureimonas TaxID=2615206 RepID=UPI0006FCBBE8|nr:MULTISPECIES: hypothetical protein [unclassified Aureimonas]KQT54007.1 hypothetical protein ASG62_12345 [Aureimonas sp. Leaf427]KQT71553.1 hypothetical protein ASG54_18815 [Aureimonas sp. Leaf460]